MCDENLLMCEINLLMCDINKTITHQNFCYYD